MDSVPDQNQGSAAVSSSFIIMNIIFQIFAVVLFFLINITEIIPISNCCFIVTTAILYLSNYLYYIFSEFFLIITE